MKVGNGVSIGRSGVSVDTCASPDWEFDWWAAQKCLLEEVQWLVSVQVYRLGRACWLEQALLWVELGYSLGLL